MTSISAKRKAQLPSQAFLAKTFHWVNLISLILMLTSGLKSTMRLQCLEDVPGGIFLTFCCWEVGWQADETGILP